MKQTIRSTVYKGLAVTLISVCTNVTAAPSECPQHYAASTPPRIGKARQLEATRELCSTQFVVLHSGVTRTPLYAAERLTRAMLSQAHEQMRTNSFHPDARLSPAERAELRDYARSGYDRGHLAPSANMIDEDAQDESFALSNMVPQDPTNNRYLWSGIESTTRLLAKRSGELFVVTGTIYSTDSLQYIGNRVLVPTHLYKALYDPKTGEAAAYVTRNDDSPLYATVTLSELERITGVQIFPGVVARSRSMELPGPFRRGSKTTAYQRVPIASLFDTKLRQ